MADVVTFDPDNLRIVEISTGSDNELDASEIYSEWKAWVLASPSRLGYPTAFRYVGSDPITEAQSLGSTYFLTGGWRIRPAEHSHKLTIIGNIFSDPAGFSIFAKTLGAYNVHTETQVSTLIFQLAGGDPGVVADAVWDEARSGHASAGTFGHALVETIASRAAPGDAMALSGAAVTAVVNAVMGAVVEGSMTLTQAQRIMLAVVSGKVSSTGLVVRFRSMADDKDRVVATVDGTGNRLSVDLDAS